MQGSDTSSSATLGMRLARLEDIEQVRTLRMRYHHYINSARFDLVHELVTTDGVVDLGYFGAYEGKQAVADGFRAMGERERFLMKQFMTSHTVDLDGAEGRGSSHLLAFYAHQGTSYVVAGCYEDEYAKTASGWLFSRMTLTPYFTVPSELGWAGEEIHHLRR